MNYDHVYHAGNHADVLKHLVVLCFAEALTQKPTPWCYLDTHAGCGIYDFSHMKKQEAPEYHHGVQLLRAMSGNKPALCDKYLSIVASVNKTNTLRYYPGSTYFVRQVARQHDRLIACEWQEAAYLELKTTFHRDANVAIHHMDGYLGLKAFLPPKEKRGFVLIDPPYEADTDWQQTITTLERALTHWRSGQYLLWYPLKNRSHIMGWLRKLQASLQNDILIIELCPFEAAGNQLYGSGMVIINPFWKFKEQFMGVLDYVWQALSVNKKGYFRLLSLDSVVK